METDAEQCHQSLLKDSFKPFTHILFKCRSSFIILEYSYYIFKSPFKKIIWHQNMIEVFSGFCWPCWDHWRGHSVPTKIANPSPHFVIDFPFWPVDISKSVLLNSSFWTMHLRVGGTCQFCPPYCWCSYDKAKGTKGAYLDTHTHAHILRIDLKVTPNMWRINSLWQ